MNKRITKKAPKLGIRLTAKFAAVAAAVFALQCPAFAAVKTLAGGNGQNSFPGGRWDFNTTANWTEDDYMTRGTWTSNDDIAIIDLYTNSWGPVTIAISNNFGAVGAAGIVVTNELKAWHHLEVNGDTLTLGASGVKVYSKNSDSYVNFNTPIALAAGQIWRNSKPRALNGGGTVIAKNVLSSVGGQNTPITFDGFNVTDPSLTADASSRVGFGLSADNTFSGATTVSGGAILVLGMSATYPNQRLDSASPLILNGGTLVMTGTAATYTQSVASVVIKAGHNHITGSNGKGVFLCNNVVREGVGGTLNTTVDWSGGVNVLNTNANDSNGIIGGWFTSVNQSFARAAGSTGASGGVQRWNTDEWRDNDNVAISGGGTRTLGDVAPNSLRCAEVRTNDFGAATITVKSGGILVPVAGSRFIGGRLRSGMDTGELFIHAFRPFAIDSIIEDNGATPCILVKSGDRELTLTGASTYTGDTYLNGGTLALEGSASMSAPCHQAGGTTLSISKGARLAPLSGGYTLGGNLLLGAGAVVELQADSTNAQGEAAPPITLENPWGTFRVSATENAPASLAISFNDTDALRPGNTFRLIEWQPTTALSGITPEAFALTLPRHMEGELVIAPTGLDFVVTQVPGIATIITVK